MSSVRPAVRIVIDFQPGMDVRRITDSSAPRTTSFTAGLPTVTIPSGTDPRVMVSIGDRACVQPDGDGEREARACMCTDRTLSKAARSACLWTAGENRAAVSYYDGSKRTGIVVPSQTWQTRHRRTHNFLNSARSSPHHAALRCSAYLVHCG